MNVKLSVALALILSSIILIKYGTTIDVPISNKILKRDTVASVISKIKPDATTRLKEDLKIELDQLPLQLLIIGLKEEQMLEVYTKDNEHFQLLKKYPFTGFSGAFGPKLMKGDLQIPEGIYTIEYLNPNSNFHLSMKINYPNEFDKSKTILPAIRDMGGDIFIHGKSQTIGCIPIGNEAIEELFVLVENSGIENVKVIISPRDFRIDRRYPEIERIEWEGELYEIIEKELNKIIPLI